MKTPYTVIIYTPQDLNHASYIQTGLFELEHRSLINCKIKVSIGEKRGRIDTSSGNAIISTHPQQKTSYYKLIDHETSREYLFATDLYDISYYFSEYALKNCDFIFKRNYISKDIKSLKPEYQAKIYPMGLTLGLQSVHRKFWSILSIAHFLSNLKLQLKFDRNLIKRIRKVIQSSAIHRKYVNNGRLLTKLEETPSKSELKVFYQVRCFPQMDIAFVKEINNQRGSLIRLFKKELGKKYSGGLVPDSIAKTYYPDYITSLPTDPNSYLDEMKKSAICIYTKGLQDSPARKLAEYLALGKCIVAERYATEFPVPLENGKNIIFFDTPEECVKICKQLLKNPEQVESLSLNARAYFETHIHPVQNVKRILELMLKKSLD
jgi:hypothetical protein